MSIAMMCIGCESSVSWIKDQILTSIVTRAQIESEIMSNASILKSCCLASSFKPWNTFSIMTMHNITSKNPIWLTSPHLSFMKEEV